MREENSGMSDLIKAIKLDVPISPVAKARPRFTRSGRVYTPKRTTDFEGAIKMYWKKSGQTMLPVAPTYLTILFFMPRPKKTKFDWPITRPDVDNLQKGVIDSLNQLAWKDDNQIVTIHATKLYGEIPCVSIVAYTFT